MGRDPMVNATVRGWHTHDGIAARLWSSARGWSAMRLR